MTIKELAYSAQLHLEAETGCPFKRAHVYELMAASFGFSSYAALNACAVFTEHPAGGLRPRSSLILQRSCALGYSAAVTAHVARALPMFLDSRQMACIRIDALVRILETGWVADAAEDMGLWSDEPDTEVEDLDYIDSNEFSSAACLMDGLHAAAGKGSAIAHYALALIHEPDDDTEDALGGAHWSRERRLGRVLSGAEREWADAHDVLEVRRADYERHLREAARLGSRRAQLDLASRFGDPLFFEQAGNAVEGLDAAEVAGIAEAIQRVDDARHWWTEAAQNGDVDAMRRLIELDGQRDPIWCWTWFHLARLYGEDLASSHYRAIDEDGFDYDDDAGGPAYADGGPGIMLAPLDAQQDALAKREAQRLFVQKGTAEGR